MPGKVRGPGKARNKLIKNIKVKIEKNVDNLKAQPITLNMGKDQRRRWRPKP